MKKEYKPGFKAWLFSIFLAAGFGSLLADGVRLAVNHLTFDNAKLELRDKQCSLDGSDRYQCNYYVENIGDEVTYVTSAKIGDKQHDTMFTNHPIAISSSQASNPIQQAHVAIARPKEVLMIALLIPQEEDKLGNVCLLKSEETLICI